MVVPFALASLLLGALVAPSAAASTPSVNWKNVTGTSSEAYPTDVGMLGPTEFGAAPFVAQKDRVNSTSIPNSAIEMRWKPKNADKDHATSDLSLIQI